MEINKLDRRGGGGVKVSIVVPAYNIENYFGKCMDSLVNQTLQEIEIIVGLDCPTDNTSKIAEDYAARDNRVILIRNKKNMHIGITRNICMTHACGEYMGFVDGDDFVEPTMFEKLYTKAAAENLDIVKCYRIDYVDELHQTKKSFNLSLEKNVEHYWVECTAVWQVLFRTEFLRRYDFKFFDTKKMFPEDINFVVEALLKTTKTGQIPDYLYYYVQREGNTKNFKNWFLRLPAREYKWAVLEKNGCNQNLKNLWAIGTARLLYSSFLHIHAELLTKLFSSEILWKHGVLHLLRHPLLLLRLKPTIILFLLYAWLRKMIR